MSVDDLKLLFKLYVQPRAALSAIVDEGSLRFGALAVFLVSVAESMVAYASPAGQALAAAMAEAGDDLDLDPSSQTTQRLVGWLIAAVFDLVGLGLLYVPSLIFVMTVADRKVGSFGVALPRDWGSVAGCAFYAWAAARLPFVLVGVVLTLSPLPPSLELPAPIVLAIAPLCLFLFFMCFAVLTVYGAPVLLCVLAPVVATVSLLLRDKLGLLASPFILYFLWIYLRSDISAIHWSLGSSRAFKRHMEAATINPRDAGAHYQLGLIHQRRRQYPEAIERFEKAVSIDAGELDAHYQLGRIAREQGRHADAIRHFEPVVARDPRHSRYEIWREVGATYIDAGDFANARPMLERYVDDRPYDPEGLYLLGLALKKQGEPDRARVLFERCIEATRTAPEYRHGELRQWRSRAQAEL